MSDYDFPELPSDEELGITDDDLEHMPEDDGPELTPEEMEALGLGPPAPARAPASGSKGGAPKAGSAGPSKEEKKARAKEEKARAKAQKAAEKRAKAEAKKAAARDRKAAAQAAPQSGPAIAEPEPGATEPGDAGGPAKPKAAPGPRSRWAGPSMAALLVIGAFLSSIGRFLPSPAPANAADTAFSSARAMSHLVEIARAAHPTGSPEHERVRAYIVGRLADMGLDVEIQTARPVIGFGTAARGATVRNILARIPGTDNTGAILLTAHYDAAGHAHGAGDDATGVVTVLETVRTLLASAPLRNDVIVLITDAEELGLLGMRAFVDEHPWIDDVAVALSVEMRGGGGPSYMFETGAENGWIVGQMVDAGVQPYAASFLYELYRRMPNDTDFTPLKEAGKQGLNFAGAGRANVYHQVYDDPGHLSEATVQHHGENVLGVTRHLGNQSLTEVTADDATYHSLPFLGVFAYDTGLTIPITAALLALLALMALVIRRAGGGWGGVLVGLGLSLIAASLSAGAGLGLMRWLPAFHPEFGSLPGGAFHSEGWYVVSLLCAVFAIVALVFSLGRVKFGAAELALGALVLPVGTAVFLTFTAPASAVVLQWPTAAATVGLGALLLPRGRTTNFVRWIVAGAAALLVLAFVTSLFEVLAIFGSITGAVALGGLAAILMIMLLPAFEYIAQPNFWWAPLTAVAVGAACMGIGIRGARSTPDRPAPSTLSYLLDRGTGEALWVTDDSDDEVDQPARAWAEERAGGPFSETRALGRFGLGNRNTPVAPAAPIAVPEPEVWVLEDREENGQRRLRLALRSRIGAEIVQLLVPDGSTTRIETLNAAPLPIQDRARHVEHWGRPDPAILVEMTMPAGQEPMVDVVERHLRPGDLLGAEAFERPATLAPDPTRRSDELIARGALADLAWTDGPPPMSVDSLAGGGIPTVPPPGASFAGEALEADSLAPDSVAAPDTASPDTTEASDPTAAPDTIAAPDTVAPDTTTAPDTASMKTRPTR